jgi:phosphoglycolate phosphatase/AHBA synthesis associated protein
LQYHETMSGSSYKAILFDMDGVLVDSFEAWFHLMNGAARDFGYQPISREQFRGVWGQGPDLDVEIFFTRHTIREVESYYNRHFGEYAQHVRTNPQAKSVFNTLRERGLDVAVITNTPTPIAREVLGAGRLEPDVLVSISDVERGKPEPDMLIKALQRLGVSPDEAVLIGDSHFDREAAAAARVRYVPYDIAGNERLDVVVESL